ncbi:FAD-dependent oxidoreductase [Xanthobacter sp. AM11]|uniref:FAD-dependent oxidoreductase n=1 Tax=Xanthobacter sp. AM11 TaxID=3380643 RepID=UPI0039BF9764
MDRASESAVMTASLPVAIIGAGPVGLAAAAHLLARGLTPLAFERGAGAGTSLKAWGHVRVFSPWGYNIDAAARTLLEETGWSAPNQHSCDTVLPHGTVELAHPEPSVYIVGSKSYGRAPTLLMATGYEQVRSIAAEIAGDHDAARRVHLVLPETGACSAAPVAAGASGCCGGPAPGNADACGADGCGCATGPLQMEAPHYCGTAA